MYFKATFSSISSPPYPLPFPPPSPVRPLYKKHVLGFVSLTSLVPSELATALSQALRLQAELQSDPQASSAPGQVATARVLPPLVEVIAARLVKLP